MKKVWEGCCHAFPPLLPTLQLHSLCSHAAVASATIFIIAEIWFLDVRFTVQLLSFFKFSTFDSYGTARSSANNVELREQDGITSRSGVVRWWWRMHYWKEARRHRRVMSAWHHSCLKSISARNMFFHICQINQALFSNRNSTRVQRRILL